MKPIKSVHRLPAALALLLLASTLLLFYAGSWYTLQAVKESKERDLEERLLSVGLTISAVVSGEEYYFLDPTIVSAFKGSDLLKELQTRLREFRVRSNLRGLTIVDLQNRVLVDARGKYATGEKPAVYEIDREELESVRSGTPRCSPLYSVRDLPYKRCYIPLFDSEKKVIAALRLEASRDYFVELDRLSRALHWLAGASTVFLVLVALLFYRLLTYLIRAEERMALAERFHSLGTLSAGLAHELRNPLGIIRATAEALRDELGHSPGHETLAADIIEECDRLNDLITQLLQLARPAAPSATASARLAEIIAATIGSLQKDRKSIHWSIRDDGSPLNLAMDEKSVRQILFNVLLNAKEAMENGGTIEIAVAEKRGGAAITIKDTGKGIPQKHLKNIFDPFFTTKEKGVGLGLSLTRSLVEHYGGTIDVRSREGEGTIVSLWLPRARKGN